jgi:hypothetical protein
MLNKEQLEKLNQIFLQEIVPVFKKNPELVYDIMMKIENYRKEDK